MLRQLSPAAALHESGHAGDPVSRAEETQAGQGVSELHPARQTAVRGTIQADRRWAGVFQKASSQAAGKSIIAKTVGFRFSIPAIVPILAIPASRPLPYTPSSPENCF